MRIDIEDEGLEELILCGKTKDKRYRKLCGNSAFLRDLNKVMSILRQCEETSSLAFYGCLHYEKLKHDLIGLSSVRIGYKAKYRLLFEEFENGVMIKLIEINEHYGDK